MNLVFILLSITLAAARVHLIKLRDVDLAGSLTGGIETDPITFSLNGFPVTLGGSGQGDLTGAVKVHTHPVPPEIAGPMLAKQRAMFQVVEVPRKVQWDWLGTPYW